MEVTKKQAAEILRISPAEVVRQINSGELKGRKKTENKYSDWMVTLPDKGEEHELVSEIHEELANHEVSESAPELPLEPESEPIPEVKPELEPAPEPESPQIEHPISEPPEEPEVEDSPPDQAAEAYFTPPEVLEKPKLKVSPQAIRQLQEQSTKNKKEETHDEPSRKEVDPDKRWWW